MTECKNIDKRSAESSTVVSVQYVREINKAGQMRRIQDATR